MSHLQIRLLQKTTRALLANGVLRRHAWPLVRTIRERYARLYPDLELEALFDDDVKACLSLSSHIEAQLFWQGFQEADESTVLAMKDHLPPDGVFVDCGANIGSFTLVAARHASCGVVHAFEPSATHLERLRRNVDLNGFLNVRINPTGLSDRTKTARLYMPRGGSDLTNTGGASIFCGTEDRGFESTVEDIRLQRLDDYVREQGLTRIDVVKIDVEGAELQVLRGALDSLDRFRPVVLMEIDLGNLQRAGEDASGLIDFWTSRNYSIRRLGGMAHGTPIESASSLRAHQNVLCLPQQSVSVRWRHRARLGPAEGI